MDFLFDGDDMTEWVSYCNFCTPLRADIGVLFGDLSIDPFVLSCVGIIQGAGEEACDDWGTSKIALQFHDGAFFFF